MTIEYTTPPWAFWTSISYASPMETNNGAGFLTDKVGRVVPTVASSGLKSLVNIEPLGFNEPSSAVVGLVRDVGIRARTQPRQ